VTVAAGGNVERARALPQTGERELFYCQFSEFPCRVSAGDRCSRLSGTREH
jgi:hypothetical protein